MENVFLSLGANLKAPYQSIQIALELIDKICNVKRIKTSSYYLTSPVSSIKQPDFLNIVCQIQTDLEPLLLLIQLQKIENLLGKVPKGKEEPRIIDIDILFHGNRNSATETLKIPHPEWINRLFVLVPLAEITPMVTLPDGKEFPLQPIIDNFYSNNPQKIALYNPKDTTHENCFCC